MQTCPLYVNGEIAGIVKWSPLDNKITVWAECPFERGYIYRLVLMGEGEERLLLGVMMPKEGRFFLRKVLTEKAAEIIFLTSPQLLRGEVIRTLPGETPVVASLPPPQEPEPIPLEIPPAPTTPFGIEHLHPVEEIALITDRFISRCLEEQQGVLSGTGEDGLYLFFPFESGKELSYSPFLSIAVPVVWEDKEYIAVRIDKSGKLRPIIL